MSCLHNYIGIKGCTVPVVSDEVDFTDIVTGESVVLAGSGIYELELPWMAYRFIIKPTANSVGRIGKTLDGQDILLDTQFIAGKPKSIQYDVFGPQVIYFTEIFGIVKIYRLSVSDYQSEAPNGYVSGLLITSLPGLTLKSIEKIATTEQVNFMGVWKDVQDRSWIRLSKDFKRLLRNCYTLKKDCDYNHFICDNKAVFADAWKFLLGAELMFERAYSERINRYTTTDRETALELRELYTMEYEKSLKEAIQDFTIDDDDECLDCGHRYHGYVERLP